MNAGVGAMASAESTAPRLSARCIEAAWLSLAILVPLYFDVRSQHVFENHKVALVRVGALVLLAAWLLHRAGARRAVQLRAPRSGLVRAVLVFGGVETLATLCSLDPWVSFWGDVFRQQGLLTLGAYLVVFLAVWRFMRSPAQIDRLITAVIATSVPVCLYGLAQRLGTDPIPWSLPTHARISSSLGNPIFLGAYVAMVLFPTLGRLFESVRGQADAERPSGEHWRTAMLELVLLLQIVTLWATRSRGPILAAVAGGAVFAVCAWRHGLLDRHTARRIAASGLSVAIGLLLGGALALALSLPAADANLANAVRTLGVWTAALLAGIAAARLVGLPWRTLWPGWAQIGAITLLLVSGFGIRVEPVAEPRGGEPGWVRGAWESALATAGRRNSAVERIWYWETYLAGYLPGAPLRLSPPAPGDAVAAERLATLRPLIGHGPEVSGSVFQQRFHPELARRYPPTTAADRAHNAVWDRLVTTGALGLAAGVWLLVALLRHALSASGFKMARRDRRRLALCVAGCAVAGGGLVAAVAGPAFFGVAFQVGLVCGVLIHVCGGAVRGRPGPPGRIVSCALTAALVGHVAEGAVGFGVAATDLYFWLFAGVLAAASTRRGPDAADGAPDEAVPSGIVLGLALGTLAFGLLGQEPGLRLAEGARGIVYDVIQPGLLPAPAYPFGAGRSPPSAILFLVYVGLLLLPGLCALLYTTSERRGAPFLGLGRAATTSLAIFGLAWVAIAWHEAALEAVATQVSGRPLDDIVRGTLAQLAVHARRPWFFLAWWGASLLALSLALRGPAPRARASRRVSWAAAAVCTLLLPGVWLVGVRPLQADVFSKAGLGWRKGVQLHRFQTGGAGGGGPDGWTVSTAVLWEAALRAPGIARYWFNLAEAASAGAAARRDTGVRAAGERRPGATPADVESLDRAALFELAVEALQRARRLNRSSPVVPLNLGHLYARWSQASSDPAVGAERMERAELWYAQAKAMFGAHPDLENPLESGLARGRSAMERGER